MKWLRYFVVILSMSWSVNTKTLGTKYSGTDKLMGVETGKDKTMAARLAGLRALMAAQTPKIAAYIVPTSDAHNSEYISPTDARREWLTGFTGSAGTAVVTHSHAAVWTDGRYYTQFEKQAGKQWTLMKQSLPETPKMEEWLATNLAKGDIVALDPTTMRRADWTPLKTALKKANMELLPLKLNLVDEERRQMNDPPPPRPANPVVELPIEFAGKSSAEKLKELREKMREEGAVALVLTALDEVAYTLNLRGTDIEYNPVFFSYLVLRPEATVLFCQDRSLKLPGVDVRPYGDVYDYLQQMAMEISSLPETESKSVWVPHDSSEAAHFAAAGGDLLKEPLDIISKVSPVAVAKMVKNDVELQGFRSCHIRDGIAVVRFFRWLHGEVDSGKNITEIQAADKLLEFRQQEKHFMGPSFETIAGAGENGAVIHYSPSKEGEQTVVGRDKMFLLDSGGQYKDGTTDITRTRHMSASPTAAQKAAFTRVLKGQISLGAALFPKKVKGNVLDTLARKALWDIGLDYAHGTGHGVGHYLNVHEDPSGISWRPYPDDPGLSAGVIMSNEPGYYEVGEYGIRHEDLVEIIDVTKDSDHPRAKSIVGDFGGRGALGFSTLTMVPNQRECIDVSLLDDFELNYTNAYHARVLSTLGPILKDRGLIDDYRWLEKECRPLVRA